MLSSDTISTELELIRDDEVRVVLSDPEKAEFYKSCRSFKTDIDDKGLYIEINKHALPSVKQGDKPSVISKASIKSILELTDQQAERKVQLTPIEKKSIGVSLSCKESPDEKMSGMSPSGSVSLESSLPSFVSLRSGTPATAENEQQENTGHNTHEVEDLQQQLQVKADEIAQLKLQQPSTNVEKLKANLENQKAKVKQLESEKAELETKNKAVVQPKRGNGARYTATVGVGLATGLVTFTALERTVRLDIWVIVGMAVAFALAVSGVTYLALKPSTEVNKVKEVRNVGRVVVKRLDTIC